MVNCANETDRGWQIAFSLEHVAENSSMLGDPTYPSNILNPKACKRNFQIGFDFRYQNRRSNGGRYDMVSKTRGYLTRGLQIKLYI